MKANQNKKNYPLKLLNRASWIYSRHKLFVKKYLYFSNGRGFYDGNVYRFEKLPLDKIPKNHIRFSIDDIKIAKYPKNIFGYLSSILSDVQVSYLTYNLSQLIGGNVINPICFLGEPKTGKTVLLNMIFETFNPTVINKELKIFNNSMFLNNRLFIAEVNHPSKYFEEQYTFDFKNSFNGDKCQDDILSSLRHEYPGFILYLIFRYEDYIYERWGVKK